MENRDNEAFNYTYSAEQQEEVKAIRKKYAAPDEREDKLARLRRLDAGVTTKAMVRAVAVGIVGALMLGCGMSILMTELSELFGALAMPVGIVAGIIGIALVCAAYPIYNRVARKERERIAPEILRLTDELMK